MTNMPNWVKLDAEKIFESIKDGPATKEVMTRPWGLKGPYINQSINEVWRWLYAEGYFVQVGTTPDGSQWLYAKS